MADESKKFNCPGCGQEIAFAAAAVFSPEIMTIAYKLQPGRKMAVQDFCKSLEALAKSLKLIAKDLGVDVLVAIEDLGVQECEITASVSVTMIPPKKA